MEAFLLSAGLVAIAEIGDKTQLLALLLAVRYRAPGPILLGILAATTLNHLLAAWLGGLAAGWLGPEVLRWVLGGAFLAMALWALVPDALEEAPELPGRSNAFAATFLAFFLLEFGDKTQLATVALAARLDALLPVVAGTTLGMLLADGPVVLLGRYAGERLPLKTIRWTAAALFVAFGLAVLLEVGQGTMTIGGSP